jgi:hypothetical protein
MAGSASPGDATARPVDEDLLFAWSLAMNIDIGDDIGPCDQETVRRALDVHQSPGLVQAHVKLLLGRVQADPARLQAVMQEARERYAGRDSAGAPAGHLRGYLIAAEYATRALTIVKDAGAEHDPAAQEQLAERLHDELFPEPEPFRPGIFDRHRLVRRVARRLNLRWQFRRRRMRAACVDHRPPASANDFGMITIMFHGEEVGRLGYQICHTCHQGLICKVSIDSEYQGLGLGRRAVTAALAIAPSYVWTTTPQYDTSVRFWQRLSRVTGASLSDDPAHAGPCLHMR